MLLPMIGDAIIQTLSMLRPEELYPAWRYLDLMEEVGEMPPQEAKRWKDGIFGLMERWGLRPDDLVTPTD